jgi:putative FmdB family regulatory protein
MLYDFICESCNIIFEVQQGMKEDHEYDCEKCKAPARRVYSPITFSVDTCSDYYDDGLGCYIKNKDHRKEVMREQNVTEYNPDSIASKMKKDLKDIDADAKPEEAGAAKQQVRKEASTKRKRSQIRSTIKKLDLSQIVANATGE